MEIKLDPQAMAKVANEAVSRLIPQMQSLLDSLQASQRGKDISQVKATLGARWNQRFGETITEPRLSSWAQTLAAGGRVIVHQ